MAISTRLLLHLITLSVCSFSVLCFTSTDVNDVETDTKAILSEASMTKPISQRPLPYALSATDLTYLAMKEQEIRTNIETYAKDLEERIRLIRKYTEDYDDSSLKLTDDLPEDTHPWEKASLVASNTLTAYRMIRRLATDFKQVEDHLQKKLESDFLYGVSKAVDIYGLPTEKDLGEAVDALLRLQYFYDLDIKQFTTGNILGVQTKAELTAAHTLEIAKHAVNKEYFTLAMDWISATESKLQNTNCSTGVSMREVSEIQKRNVALHDRDWTMKQYSDHKFIFSQRIREQTQNATTMKEVFQKKFMGDRDVENKQKAHYNFMSLCNGKNFQTEKEKAKLHCWYETKINPYWRINPLKMELLNDEPMLVQIYEVISNSWISYLTESALPTLERAPESRGATPRTATYAWLNDEEIPEVQLSRRIELITGLNVRGDLAAEDLQIAAYAFGGHVSTHVDSLPENSNDRVIRVKGNRVSTFLIYLNNVVKGGLTAFPVLGTAVRPIKGSAVLWYTAKRNGVIDKRLVHGACPLVTGSKWIATKWTHLNVNFLKRRCSMDATQ